MATKDRTFKYPFLISLLYIIPSLGFILIGATLLGLTSLGFVNRLFSMSFSVPVSISQNLLGFLVAGSMALYFGLQSSALYTHIAVKSDGLMVIVLFVLPIFIPWEDIIELTAVTAPRPYNNPNKWRIIRVKRLSICHRLLSHSLTMGSNPVIIVNNALQGYDKFITIITSKIDKRE